MGAHELLVGLLLALAVLGSTLAARRVGIPYPVVLVVLGLGAGFVPGVPVPTLDPDVVFFLFLPPLLYSAAFLSSPRELARHALPIGLLAFVLVVATTCIVAVVVHVLLPQLGWALAFVLGAVVAPTDPVAATAVMRRLGVPERLRTIVEGESLVNDGLALVLFAVALEAARTGAFSFGSSAVELVRAVGAGIAIGLAVGWLAGQVRRRIDDRNVEIGLSLVTPFAAYLAAEEAGGSGVLGVVACGLLLGWISSDLTDPGTRLEATAFWNVLSFGLNAAIFVLIGLQLPEIASPPGGQATVELVAYGIGVSAVVIGLRVAWQLIVPHAVAGLGASRELLDPRRSLPERLVVGWSGMRGAVSLAAALSIPLVGLSGEELRGRSVVLFVTFVVICTTLVLQGTTLPFVIRAFALGEGDRREHELTVARREVTAAALARMDELDEREEIPAELLESLRGVYEHRLARLEGELAEEELEDRPDLDHETYRRFRRELLSAERERLRALHAEGLLTFEQVREIQRELDLAETLVDGGEGGGA
ncbi:MAG: Na+/H+ antiporter [Thermoleophilia bacterium]